MLYDFDKTPYPVVGPPIYYIYSPLWYTVNPSNLPHGVFIYFLQMLF